MYISRGFDRTTEGAEPPQTLEYWLMHDRLTSLERLARIRESGVLSDEEFAAEKERILSLPSEELILRPVGALRGPSLFGRLLNWKLIALGILLGLGLAAFTQPEAAVQALQRIGLAE
jgi:Short C-terminal domain